MSTRGRPGVGRGEGLGGAGGGWRQAHVPGVRGQEPVRSQGWSPGFTLGQGSLFPPWTSLPHRGCKGEKQEGCPGSTTPATKAFRTCSSVSTRGHSLTAVRPPSAQLPAPRCQQEPPVGTRTPCPPLPRAGQRESAVSAHPRALLLQVWVSSCLESQLLKSVEVGPEREAGVSAATGRYPLPPPGALLRTGSGVERQPSSPGSQELSRGGRTAPPATSQLSLQTPWNEAPSPVHGAPLAPRLLGHGAAGAGATAGLGLLSVVFRPPAAPRALADLHVVGQRQLLPSPTGHRAAAQAGGLLTLVSCLLPLGHAWGGGRTSGQPFLCPSPPPSYPFLRKASASPQKRVPAGRVEVGGGGQADRAVSPLGPSLLWPFLPLPPLGYRALGALTTPAPQDRL